MPSMDKLRNRIRAAEMTSREENLKGQLGSFATYQDMTRGRHKVYQKLSVISVKPNCTVCDIWKTTYGLMKDIVMQEQNVESSGSFEACREVLTQWGGSRDEVVRLIRIAKAVDECHESWYQYLQNASFISTGDIDEEELYDSYTA